MILLHRILAFTTPLLIVGILFLGFSAQDLLIGAIILSILLLIITLLFLTKVPVLSKEMGLYSVSPLFFFISMIGFVLLLESVVVRDSVVIVGMVLILLYLENIFTYFYNRKAYQTHALTNISSYLNIITIFLMGVNAFGSLTLLQAPLWSLSLLLVIVIALLTTQSYWMHSIATRKNYVFSLLVTILMIELFWAFAFLPNNFYVNSILLAISYYVVWGIFRAHLLKLLTKKLLLRYIIVGLASFIFILMTSQWT